MCLKQGNWLQNTRKKKPSVGKKVKDAIYQHFLLFPYCF